jgi:MFS family permease
MTPTPSDLAPSALNGAVLRAPGKAPWNRLVRLSFAQMVSWALLYYTFSVVQVPMTTELGWSTPLISGGFSLALLVYACAGPFLGSLFDRRGTWVPMLCGAFGGALVLALWSRVTQPSGYLALMALLGVAMAACLYEPAFYLIARWFPQRRAKAITVLTFFGALASPLALPIIERLCAWIGWRDTLLVLAGFVAIVVIPLLLSLPRRHARIPASRTGTDSNTKGVLQETRFWWLQCGFITVSVTAIAIPFHLVPYLVERGESLTFAAGCTGAIALVGIGGRLLLGLIGEQRGLIVFTVIVFALMSAAVTSLFLVPGHLGVYVFVATFGLGYGALWPTRAALVTCAWSGPSLATISGVFALGPNLAKAGAPFLAALLTSLWDRDTAFALLAALPALGAWCVWQSDRHPASRHPTSSTERKTSNSALPECQSSR